MGIILKMTIHVLFLYHAETQPGRRHQNERVAALHLMAPWHQEEGFKTVVNTHCCAIILTGDTQNIEWRSIRVLF